MDLPSAFDLSKSDHDQNKKDLQEFLFGTGYTFMVDSLGRILYYREGTFGQWIPHDEVALKLDVNRDQFRIKFINEWIDFEVDNLPIETFMIHNVSLEEFELSLIDNTKSQHTGLQEWLSQRTQSIGRWGEEFALKSLLIEIQERYPKSRLSETSLGYVLMLSNKKAAEIIWCNKVKESNSSPDLITWENEDEKYWEVKTTTDNKLKARNFTESERKFAVEKGENYNLLIVTNAGSKSAKIHMAPNPFWKPEPPKNFQFYEGIGRRKRSTARVRIIINGSGEIIINSKEPDLFFKREGDYSLAFEPLLKIKSDKQYINISVTVHGGGISGQRDAIRLGLARALVKYIPELRKSFRKSGYLTRDSRIKERKKPGLKRARKAPTYTKR